MARVRRLDQGDGPKLAMIDLATFPSAPFPAALFAQALHLWPHSCVIEVDGQIVGYGLVATNTDEEQTAWIVSLAVSPSFRGSGLGSLMLAQILDSLRDEGHGAVRLFVEPDNSAVRLYENFGFTQIGGPADRLEDGSPRLLLEHQGDAPQPEPPNVTDLMAEAGIGVQFVSILFAVSAVLAGVVGATGEPSAVASTVILLFVAVLGSLFAGLFYANVSGGLARQRRVSEVPRPMRYGNVFSEYFAVVPLLASLTPAVAVLTESPPLAYIVLSLTVTMFLVYQTSSFDITSRFVHHTAYLVGVNMILVALLVMVGIGEIRSVDIAGISLSVLSSVALLAVSVALALLAFFIPESSRPRHRE